MATKRLVCAMILSGLAAAQSPPQQDAPKPEPEIGATASQMILESLKSLEERIALLEQELLEVRLQSKANAAGPSDPAPAGGARRPQIEEEEPFDAAKLAASDDEEVEAVAKAVAVLLPQNVRKLGNSEPPRVSGAPPAPASPSPRPSAVERAPVSQSSVQAGGPKPVRRVEPVIPASMRNSIAGEVNVSVKVYVGANGEVIGTVPVKQGEPTADQIGVLAAEAVTRWRFEPVLHNGQPVATQTMVRFRFAR